MIDRLLSRISITRKILIIFLGCTIIPMGIQIFYYYSETEANIQSEIIQIMDSAMNEKADKLAAYITDVVGITIKYNNDERIYKWLNAAYQDNYDYLIVYQDEIQQLVNSDLPYYPQIDRIVFYTDNPAIFNGALVITPARDGSLEYGDELIDYRETPLQVNNQSLKFRVSIEKSATSQTKNVSILRDLNYFPQYSATNKMIRIDLNTTYLSALLSENDLFDDILLADSDNNALISANNLTGSGTIGVFHQDELDASIVVLEKQLDEYPLKLYGYYNSDIISRQFGKSRTGVVAVALISVALALLFILTVGRNISNRTQNIVVQASQIAKGNFVQIENRYVNSDELGSVEQSINTMSQQLKDLVEREYKSQLLHVRLEKETAQAKLMALQSQINPHFLFNALESIRMNAVSRDERETATMIKYMSKMFRHILNWNDDIVRLRDDVDFLSEYLSIQKYRFGEDFSYTITMDEMASDCLLPKLIIQPLVENACVHGAEAAGVREVLVDISIDDGRLCVSVADNGGGMDRDTLERLKASLAGAENPSGSVGLYNVYQRLHLYYGDGFSFDIDSAPGKGMFCLIDIPARYEWDA